MLTDGCLHLSGIARLAPLLTEDNRETVLARAVGMSKREIEELVAELSPKDDVPATIRKLPDRRGKTNPTSSGLLVPERVDRGVGGRWRKRLWARRLDLQMKNVDTALSLPYRSLARRDTRCELDIARKYCQRYGRHHGRRVCGGGTRALLVRYIADRLLQQKCTDIDRDSQTARLTGAGM